MPLLLRLFGKPRLADVPIGQFRSLSTGSKIEGPASDQVIEWPGRICRTIRVVAFVL